MEKSAFFETISHVHVGIRGHRLLVAHVAGRNHKGSTSPSRYTSHTGRGPFPWLVSFARVADKLDNFSATYSCLSLLYE